MRLIVGLGNPGRQYAGTRHNIGFEVVDALAAHWNWTARPEDFDRMARNKFEGLAMDGPAGETGENVLLLKPMTFMNLSGQTVQAAMAFYRLNADQTLIVLDDLALPCGRMRVRSGGSSGGHNGLRDIERALGTDVYPRLRIGIDPPPPRMPQKDYVLGRFTEWQRSALAPVISRACQAVCVWTRDGIAAAMNRFNPDPDASKKNQTDST